MHYWVLMRWCYYHHLIYEEIELQRSLNLPKAIQT